MAHSRTEETVIVSEAAIGFNPASAIGHWPGEIGTGFMTGICAFGDKELLVFTLTLPSP